MKTRPRGLSASHSSLRLAQARDRLEEALAISQIDAKLSKIGVE